VGQKWIVHVEEVRYGTVEVIDQDGVPDADKAQDWATLEYLILQRARVLHGADRVRWTPWERTLSSPITPERDERERNRAAKPIYPTAPHSGETTQATSSDTAPNITAAINGGADLITDTLNLGDRDLDLVGLVANAILTRLENPAASFQDVVKASYSVTPDEIRNEWWGGWA